MFPTKLNTIGFYLINDYSNSVDYLYNLEE